MRGSQRRALLTDPETRLFRPQACDRPAGSALRCAASRSVHGWIGPPAPSRWWRDPGRSRSRPTEVSPHRCGVADCLRAPGCLYLRTPESRGVASLGDGISRPGRVARRYSWVDLVTSRSRGRRPRSSGASTAWRSAGFPPAVAPGEVVHGAPDASFGAAVEGAVQVHRHLGPSLVGQRRGDLEEASGLEDVRVRHNGGDSARP
jgi:hypothetical protein